MVVGEVGVTIVAGAPTICVQYPVHRAGRVAAIVVLVEVPQSAWSGPALATTAVLMVSVIELVAFVQGGLALTLRVRTTVPAAISYGLGV